MKQTTAIEELIEKFKDAQKHIISKKEYANGYDGALSDCINVAKSFLEKEKQQIIDAVNEHDKKCINICNNMVKKINPKIDSLFEYNGEEGLQYYNEKYGNK
jgi:hypothetical protein